MMGANMHCENTGWSAEINPVGQSLQRCNVPDGLPAAIHQLTVAEYIVGINRIG